MSPQAEEILTAIVVVGGGFMFLLAASIGLALGSAH